MEDGNMTWEERMKKLLAETMGVPTAEAASEESLPPEDDRWKKAMEASTDILRRPPTKTMVEGPSMVQGPGALPTIPPMLRESQETKPAPVSPKKPAAPKPVIPAKPAAGKPKTPMAQQMKDFWEKDTYKPDRKANTIGYKEAGTGADVTLEMEPGSIPPPRGSAAFENYLRSIKGYIDKAPTETIETPESAPAATPAAGTPADSGRQPPATYGLQMPELQGISPKKPQTLPGGYQAFPTEAQEGSSAISRSKKEYDPNKLQDLGALLEEQEDAVLRESPYQKLIGKEGELTPIDEANWEKERARQEYIEQMDSNRKGELWDQVIRAIGRIGAGAYGLHSGLDVSKYYQPEKTFDREKEDKAAKERQAIAYESADQPVNTAMQLAALQEKISQSQGAERQKLVDNYMKILKMTGEKTGLQQEVAKKLGIQITPPARPSGKGDKLDEKTLKPQTSTEDAIKEAGKRSVTLDAKRKAPLGTTGRNGILTNLKDLGYNQSTVENIVNSATEIEQAKNKKDPKYPFDWATVQRKTIDTIKRMEDWNSARTPTSEQFSKWYIGSYLPLKAKYGDLGVTAPDNIISSKRGATEQLYDPTSYLMSHYRNWLSKQKGLSTLSPESPEALNAYRKAHGLLVLQK